MKRQFLLFVLALLPLLANADAVEIDGIYYNLNTETREAEVTSNPNKYTGDVAIPDKVTYESVEYSVTSIGYLAFSGDSGLTSVTIPNSVTFMNTYVFKDCSNLTSITISNNVKSINFQTFYGCKALTSVTIPNGVTSIGYQAFAYCSSLTSITIPNSVTSIDDMAFTGCSGLKSLTLGSSVTSIGDLAFPRSSLNSIIVEDDNQKYDSRNDCNAIIETLSNTLIVGCKNTTIPNSVTYIGSLAFFNCKGLISIDIPNSVKSIGESAFAFCTDLTSANIPNSVTSIGNDAFQNCKSLTSITIPNNLLSISKNTFADCTSLASINIPNSVTSIEESAFSNSGLTSITIPQSVTSISIDAFKNCRAIAFISVDDGNTIYDSRNDCNAIIEKTSNTLFLGCKNATIPNNVTRIGEYAFYGCVGLTSVNFPSSVASIGDYAFYGCSGLTSVTVPNTVKKIGNCAFDGCSLESLVIPESIIKRKIHVATAGTLPELIPEDEKYSIEELTISGNLNGTDIHLIRDMAGVNMDNMTYRYKPEEGGITSGKLSFLDMSDAHIVEGGREYYKMLCTSESWMSWDGYQYTKDNSISDCMFAGCCRLRTLILPQSVTSIVDPFIDKPMVNPGYVIGVYLTSVTIPNSVMSISENAFSGCNSLTSVTVENPTPVAITSNTFSNRANATLYVPAGSKAAYQAADYWKEFKEIVEFSAIIVKDLSICKGGKIKLPVSMENEEEITAFQFDVEVPQGITVTDVQLGERSSDSHTVDYSKQADGSYRVIAVSLQKAPFSGNEGELVSLMLSADKDIEAGDYSIGVKNIVLTTTSKEKIYPADVYSVLSVLNIRQGDADGDGFVDVADIVTMIDYILDSSTSDIIFLAADMNADGEIDIFDVMIAINIILNRDNSAGSRTRASDNMEEQAVVTATADGMMLGVNDADRFTAFQFDVKVADGMELTEARLNGDAGNHKLYFLKNGQNAYRMIGVSMDNSTLTASGNDLIRLSFSKDGQVQISNIVFVTPQKSKVYFASGNSEVTGIGSIEYEQAEEIFDLSGRKIDIGRSRLPKGVYIINNKKVVVR